MKINFFNQQWKTFRTLLCSSYGNLVPIVVVIVVFQIGIFRTVPADWQSTVISLLIVGVGLAVFMQGLELGIFPIGENLAKEFENRGSRLLLISFAFLLSYGTTIAEPALQIIANTAMIVSEGRISSFVLRQVVALSVGCSVALGVFRIVVGHPIHYYIISGYIFVLAVTYVTPAEMVSLAYDLGGVTTSTVTVPLIAALGIGLAKSIKGRNPAIDGFGLIAFAALAPIIFVQFYGIYAYQFAEVTAVDPAQLQQMEVFTLTWQNLLGGLFESFFDVVPIIVIILFCHYVVLRKRVEHIQRVTTGFALTILGLYIFVMGLKLGLFAIGESMALQLVNSGSHMLIFMFAAAIGFAATMAEPSLLAIANKVEEISNGRIHNHLLRVFVALGVAVGITIGCYRIIQGDPIHFYIMSGYAAVVVLTFFSPRYIIPIAYDSGGVTTSTVTVPLVAALGIGLSTEISGRNPLIDGFGLIAFASLFPVVTVLLYGLLIEKFSKNNLSNDKDNVV